MFTSSGPREKPFWFQDNKHPSIFPELKHKSAYISNYSQTCIELTKGKMTLSSINIIYAENFRVSVNKCKKNTINTFV
jgi:hypothetical protein